VHAVGADLHVERDGVSWAGSGAPAILDDPAEPALGDADALLERVTRATLSGVQDAIARSTGAAWPVVPGEPSTMPEPGARVVDGVLHTWFGGAADPVLRLHPISTSG